MALITTNAFMTAIKFKLGFAVMVKIPHFPIPRIVASFAGSAQLQFMHILFGVAAVAIRFRIFVFWR